MLPLWPRLRAQDFERVPGTGKKRLSKLRLKREWVDVELGKRCRACWTFSRSDGQETQACCGEPAYRRAHQTHEWAALQTRAGNGVGAMCLRCGSFAGFRLGSLACDPCQGRPTPGRRRYLERAKAGLHPHDKHKDVLVEWRASD